MKKGILSGIIYGLLPHTFCILFIIFSVFGVTSTTFFFKGILLNKNFFYHLVLLSFAFATITAILYLKRNGILSANGIKRSLSYLSILYGTTLGINLLLFLVIFPKAANFSLKNERQVMGISKDERLLALRVEVPCSGHAPLIVSELKEIEGIREIKFRLPNLFNVYYDSAKITPEKILSQDIFKSFKAVVVQ